MTHRRKFLIDSTLGVLTCTSALAQTNTAAPSRLVVGFAAGGATDTVARLLSKGLQSTSAGTFIVDNKPGAAGRLGATEVKNASANGLTVLITPDVVMTIYPLVYKKLAYDPLTDFKPVSNIATVPLGIAVGPMVPNSVKTLADFVAWLKANPEKASFGTAGAGSSLHFIGFMFGKLNGLDFQHVPYRGSGPAIIDVISGQIAACVATLADFVQGSEVGKLRVLAISSATRSRSLPNVPTFREAGHPSLEVVSWVGAFVPAKTPDAVVQRLQAAINEAANSNEMRQGLEKLGFQVTTSTPNSLGALVKSDIEKWTPMVKASGYTAEE